MMRPISVVTAAVMASGAQFLTGRRTAAATMDPKDGDLFVAVDDVPSRSNPCFDLYRVTPAGIVSLIGRYDFHHYRVVELEFGRDGKLYTADAAGRTYEIDPVTGTAVRSHSKAVGPDSSRRNRRKTAPRARETRRNSGMVVVRGVGTRSSRKGFDPADVEQQAVLVHELTHFLQYHRIQSGAMAAPSCRNRLEPEAYRLQNKWLVKNGRQPAYPEWQILLLGSCPEDWMLYDPHKP